MKILKRESRNSVTARKRVERDEDNDAAKAAQILSRQKAVEAVEKAGLDPRSALTPPKEPTPYDIKAQQIFSKSLTGKVFTPAQFRTNIQAYFSEVDNRKTTFLAANTAKSVEVTNRRPYTIEGLCDALGITKTTFMAIAHDEAYGELYKIAKIAEQKIVARLLDLGLMNETNPALTKFYLKNVSDLQDKVAGSPTRIGNITFVTVNNREELQRLAKADGEVIDVTAEDADGTAGHDK
jgi:hypothetical protein